MTRAFWTVAAATGDGTPDNPRRPALNFGGQPNRVTVAGDLTVAKETAGAGAHRHLLCGTILHPHPSDGHWHRVIQRTDGTVYQEWVAGGGGGSTHAHAGDLWPDYYLCFVLTTDAGAANLLTNNGVREIAPCAIANGVIGAVSATPYTGPELTWLTNNMLSMLGLSRPAVVDRPSRWLEWILPISLSRVVRDERAFRFAAAALG